MSGARGSRVPWPHVFLVPPFPHARVVQFEQHDGDVGPTDGLADALRAARVGGVF